MNRLLHPHVISRLHHLGRSEHYIISIMLRDFGMMMVEVFVPIILLIEGMSLFEVALYFTYGSLIRLIAQFANPWLFKTIGIQHTLAISYIVSVAYIISVNYISSGVAPFLISGFLYGLSQSLFWVSRHVDTIEIVSGKSSSKKISYLGIAATILAIIAPFIGGLLAEYMSSEVLLATVFGVMISAILAISNELLYEKQHRKHKPNIKLVLGKKERKAYKFNFLDNYQSQSSGYIWPIFIYFSVDNLGTIGGIIALNSLVVMGLYYYTGKVKNQNPIMIIGSVIRAISMGLMTFANSALKVFGIDFINSVGRGFRTVGYADYFYKTAHKSKDPAATVIMLEGVGEVAKTSMWGLLALLAYLEVADPFLLIFLLGVPASLILSAVRD